MTTARDTIETMRKMLDAKAPLYLNEIRLPAEAARRLVDHVDQLEAAKRPRRHPRLNEWCHWVGNNRVTLILDGVEYRCTGWFGCQLESIERRRVPAGTTRAIAGQRFTVYSTHRLGLFRFRTTWTLTRLPDNLDDANAMLHAFNDLLRGMI